MSDLGRRVSLGAGWVDPVSGHVCVDGEQRRLSSRERRLLAVLLARAGQTIPRDLLIAEGWGGDAAPRTVDSAVRRLRAKLERDPARPEHLLTVQGEGYRFVGVADEAPVIPAPPPEPPEGRYGLGEAVFDAARRQWLDGRGVVTSLTTKEAELLAALAARPGQAVSREQLQREVWGHRNRSTLRYVDYVVHGLRKKVEPEPGRPRYLISVPAVGYRLDPGEGAAPAPPPVSATNLGADTTSFLGRSAEREQLSSSYTGGARLVTVTGPGGCGKTRLARRFAADQLGHGEVWLCELTSCESLDEVLELVTRTLALEPGARDPVHVIGAALAGRSSVLLVLDNAEHLVSALAPVVAGWLRATRECRVLVTSRIRLGLVEEHVLAVGPLPGDDAVSLYAERVAQLRPGYAPVGAEATSIRQLCEALDGLPLAIELAAARSAVLSPAQLLAHLDERFVLLRRSSGERHSSLWSTISCSWDLLSAEERSTLAQLSVFRGSFDLAGLEGVVSLEPSAPPALELLEALLQHSLVYVVDERGPLGLRFALYESIREFALAKLDEHGQVALAELRHAVWYSARAQQWYRAMIAMDDRTARALAGAERDNLVTAVVRSMDVDPVLAAHCVGALALTAVPRSGTAALLEQVDRLIAGVATHEVDLVARLLKHRSMFHRVQGRFTEASADLEQARQISGLDSFTRALVWADLADVAYLDGRYADAERWLEEAEALGEPWPLFQPMLARTWGLLFLARGEPVRAVEALERARREYRRLGCDHKAADQSLNLAMVYLQLGRSAEAIPILAEGAADQRRHGRTVRETACLNALGAAQLDVGDLEGAEHSLRRAAELAANSGTMGLEAQALGNLATVERARGRVAEALALRQRSLALHRASGSGAVLMSLLNVACDAMSVGSRLESHAALREAGELARERGSDRGIVGACALSALHHGLWGSAVDAEAAVAAAEAALIGAPNPEGAALAAVAREFVQLAAARAGDRQAHAGLLATLDQGWPEPARFELVRWARGLLGAAAGQLDPV